MMHPNSNGMNLDLMTAQIDDFDNQEPPHSNYQNIQVSPKQMQSLLSSAKQIQQQNQSQQFMQQTGTLPQVYVNKSQGGQRQFFSQRRGQNKRSQYGSQHGPQNQSNSKSALFFNNSQVVQYPSQVNSKRNALYSQQVSSNMSPRQQIQQKRGLEGPQFNNPDAFNKIEQVFNDNPNQFSNQFEQQIYDYEIQQQMRQAELDDPNYKRKNAKNLITYNQFQLKQPFGSNVQKKQYQSTFSNVMASRQQNEAQNYEQAKLERMIHFNTRGKAKKDSNQDQIIGNTQHVLNSAGGQLSGSVNNRYQTNRGSIHSNRLQSVGGQSAQKEFLNSIGFDPQARHKKKNTQVFLLNSQAIKSNKSPVHTTKRESIGNYTMNDSKGFSGATEHDYEYQINKVNSNLIDDKVSDQLYKIAHKRFKNPNAANNQSKVSLGSNNKQITLNSQLGMSPSKKKALHAENMSRQNQINSKNVEDMNNFFNNDIFANDKKKKSVALNVYNEKRAYYRDMEAVKQQKKLDEKYDSVIDHLVDEQQETYRQGTFKQFVRQSPPLRSKQVSVMQVQEDPLGDKLKEFFTNILPQMNQEKFDKLIQANKNEILEKYDDEQHTKLLIKIDHQRNKKNVLTKEEKLIKEYINSLNQDGQTKRKKTIGSQMRDMFRIQLSWKHQGRFIAYIDKINESKVTLQKLSDDFKKKIDFIQLCKDSNAPMADVKYKHQPDYVYFNTCTKYNNLAFPLLQKVAYETLILHDYTLDKGQCEAISKACNLIHGDIKGVLFDNCGIDDHEFSTLLTGIQDLDKFYSIVYRNNEFGPKAVQSLEPLIKRTFPFNLQNLVIQNCKVIGKSIGDLIEIMRQRSSLRQVSFFRVNLNDQSVSNLCMYIKKQKRLIQLDLSWCEMTQKSSDRLIEALGKNRSLQSLNLSWNRLIQFQSSHVTGTAEEKEAKLKRAPTVAIDNNMQRETIQLLYQEKHRLVIKDEQVECSAESDEDSEYDEHGRVIFKQSLNKCCKKPMSDTEKIVFENLSELIYRNINLIHLDLTDCNLTHSVIIHLMLKVNKSISIQAVHLSNNPGIHSTVLKCLRKFMNIEVDDKPPQFINIEKIIRKRYQDQQKDSELHQQEIIDSPTGRRRTEMEKLMQQRSLDANQLLQLRQMVTRKRIMNTNNYPNDPQQQILIVSRHLGHKNEIRGSTRWKVYTKSHEDCWICDKKLYTLIFWNQELGQSLDYKDIAVKKLGLLQISMHQDALQTDENNKEVEEVLKLKNQNQNQEKAYIRTAFDGWKEKKMLTIEEYCWQIDKSKPDILQDMINSNQCDKDIKSPDQLEGKALHIYNTKLQHQMSKYTHTFGEIIQKNLSWQNPNIVNSEMISMFDNGQQLFVYPCFTSCAMNYYFIKHIQDQEGQRHKKFYLHNFIGDFRLENVPLAWRKFKVKTMTRKFVKSTSMFAPWQEDNDHVLRHCFQHDQQYWKLGRIIKDKEDLGKTEELIHNYMPDIKFAFVNLICTSQYPFIDFREIEQYIHHLGLYDNKFTLANFSIMFSAVNFEEIDMDKNPDRLLVRYEFIEVLIRVSNIKFRLNNGQFKTISQAFKHLMENYVKPFQGFSPWQEFRDKALWSLHVNDVYIANKEPLQELFKCNCAWQKKYMTYNTVEELFVRKANIFKIPTHLVFCFGMSKMSITREMERQDEYHRIEFVEFLELIGRVAIIKFAHSEFEELELARKIEYILDDLFFTENLEREEVFSYDDTYEVDDFDEDY